jgi:hypothetical protein
VTSWEAGYCCYLCRLPSGLDSCASISHLLFTLIVTAPAAMTTVPGYGFSFPIVSRKGIDTVTICASLLIPSGASSNSPGSQTFPATSGVSPDGWIPISPGREKRIKRWLATEVVQGYVVARLVIGLEIFRDAIVRAMDIARDVVDGAGVWLSLCFEYTL